MFYIETNGALVLKLKANMLLTKGGNSYTCIRFELCRVMGRNTI